MYGQDDAPPHASHYKPKFVSGARLPHAWIRIRTPEVGQNFRPLDVSYVKEWPANEVAARTASILDLCPFNSFTLVVGSRDAWSPRFEQLQERLSQKSVKIKVNLKASESDFEFVFPKQQQLFAQSTQIADGGGILVRPDQHILAITGPDDTVQEIEQVILSHLGFP